MSPVSRGRKPKKAKKGKKPPARVTNSGWAKPPRSELGPLILSVPHSPLEEFFESLDDRPPWWELLLSGRCRSVAVPARR